MEGINSANTQSTLLQLQQLNITALKAALDSAEMAGAMASEITPITPDNLGQNVDVKA